MFIEEAENGSLNVTQFAEHLRTSSLPDLGIQQRCMFQVALALLFQPDCCRAKELYGVSEAVDYVWCQ